MHSLSPLLIGQLSPYAVDNWIKNVYNLGIQQVKTGGNTSTTTHNSERNMKKAGYIHSLIPTFLTRYTPQNTQPQLAVSPPINPQLYTVSTAPTITKTKEN